MSKTGAAVVYAVLWRIKITQGAQPRQSSTLHGRVKRAVRSEIPLPHSWCPAQRRHAMRTFHPGALQAV
eukprot:287337-Chlamydomonas_euryale.AAC.4